MKLLLLLALMITMGCGQSAEEKSAMTSKIGDRQVDVFIFDSCEYIGRMKGSLADVLTHKGNCRFCAKRNLEIKK